MSGRQNGAETCEGPKLLLVTKSGECEARWHATDAACLPCARLHLARPRVRRASYAEFNVQPACVRGARIQHLGQTVGPVVELLAARDHTCGLSFWSTASGLNGSETRCRHMIVIVHALSRCRRVRGRDRETQMRNIQVQPQRRPNCERMYKNPSKVIRTRNARALRHGGRPECSGDSPIEAPARLALESSAASDGSIDDSRPCADGHHQRPCETMFSTTPQPSSGGHTWRRAMERTSWCTVACES